MNTNYKSWMPNKCLIFIISITSILVIATSFLYKSGNNTTTKCIGIISLISALFTIHLLYLRSQFNLDKKESISRNILTYCATKVSLKPGDKILDVGCGSGAFGILTVKGHNNVQLVGIDSFQNVYANYFSIDICKQNAKEEGIVDATFICGDARNLPFPDNSFDVIISNYVYHNIPGKSREAIKESLRCLKKGGAFVIHDIFYKIQYGNIYEFIKELKQEGISEINYERTDNGYPIPYVKGILMAIHGSGILYGRK